MAAQTAVHILDQHQFDKYAMAWSHYVSHHQDLTRAFQQPDDSQLQAVVFSFETLEYLLSTVGARRIKAQFLLKEDKESEEKHFALALYAVDASDGRISAYYLAQSVPPAPTHKFTFELGQSGETGTDDSGTQIPNALVQTWLYNWKHAPLKTADMFSSHYGPLTGYTFDIGDFLNSFFYANPLKNKKPPKKELLVLFGLHQHYPAFPDCYALKQTFGLVLRIRLLQNDLPKGDNTFLTETEREKLHAFLKKENEPINRADFLNLCESMLAEDDAPIGQPFYDYSKPSPPY